MKLNFELTLNDLLTFNNYIQKTRGSRTKIYVIWGLLGAYLVYFFYGEFQRGLDWATGVILAFIITMAYIFMRRIFKAGESATRRAVKQNPDLIGSRTVELSEEVLTYSTPTYDSTFKIDSFIEVQETEEHLYLFNGRTSALIIPMRAFTNSSELQELKNILKK